jgi:hypothetical protein
MPRRDAGKAKRAPLRRAKRAAAAASTTSRTDPPAGERKGGGGASTARGKIDEAERNTARAKGGPRSAAATATAAFDASRRVLGETLGATPAIVIKAATIIEEEVAMGLGAAKRIEQRFLDVNALRGKPPDAVMSRFRRDAHEAVDIILDVITAAAVATGERAGRFINVTASRAAGPVAADGAPNAGLRLPTVRVPGVVAPGTVAEFAMALENESDTATVEFTLHAGELVSASGARIAADRVHFEPATLAVAPHDTGKVTVRIDVPAKTDAGTYEGLVRATQLEGLKAVLALTVGTG